MFAALTVILLLFGLLFPAVSLFTGLVYWQRGTWWSEGPSPVFIPVIGPSILTWLIVFYELPLWLILVAWLSDLGTLVFLWMLPKLIKEEWQLSRFTRILRLAGSRGNARAVLTLHTSGNYLLRKEWMQPRGEDDWASLGETGTYVDTPEGYLLRSFHGVSRHLKRTEAGRFFVAKEQFKQELIEQYSLEGWMLEG